MILIDKDIKRFKKYNIRNISIIGLILLFLFTGCSTERVTLIKELSDSKIGEKITLEGRVVDIKNYQSGSTLVLIDDKTGTVEVFIDKKDNIDIKRFKYNSDYLITGCVKKYKGKLQIVLKSNNDVIRKSGDEFKKVVVTKHIDGDTVYVTDSTGKEYKVRFIGVDCPEIKKPNKKEEFYAKNASDYTKSRLLGETIYIEKDVSETDKYDRLLRYVWIEVPINRNEEEVKNKMFNAKLLLEGYAQVMTYPPDVKYLDNFNKFQESAKNKKMGLWSK